MRSMKLRVSELYRQGEHHFLSTQLPLVQLAGGWLEEAGFPVGSRVLVEVVADGRLVLTRVDDAAAARATADDAETEAAETLAEPVELAAWRSAPTSRPQAPPLNRREAACA